MSKLPPKPPSNPKCLNFGLQNMHIQQKYSSFYLKRQGKRWVWVGYLNPTNRSSNYKVKIVYHPYQPKVFILEPQVLDFSPHRYKDQSLCLYHPNDNSFDGMQLISDTIIPWTSEWLYFYEVWLNEGVWWGAEAPHSP